MALRVGRIRICHAEPFYFDMERRGIVLYKMVPSALAAAVTDGEIDAGPVPVVDVFAWQTAAASWRFFALPRLRKLAVSSLLHGKPIANSMMPAIGVTDEASTAARLLRNVLLRVQHQYSPQPTCRSKTPMMRFPPHWQRRFAPRRGGARGFCLHLMTWGRMACLTGLRLSSPAGSCARRGSHSPSPCSRTRCTSGWK